MIQKIKNRGSVVLAMPRYNWKTSRAIFEVFKFVYLSHPEIAVKDIARGLNRQLSAVSDQLRPLREQGWLVGEERGRDKYYHVNEKKLETIFGKEKEFAKVSLMFSASFRDFFNRLKTFRGIKGQGGAKNWENYIWRQTDAMSDICFGTKEELEGLLFDFKQMETQRCTKEIKKLQESWLSGKEICEKDLREKKFDLIPKEILQQQIAVLQTKCNALDDLKKCLEAKEGIKKEAERE